MYSGLPLWAQKGGYVLGVLCLGLALWELYWGFLRRTKHSDGRVTYGHPGARYESAYIAIALLWGVGLGCKVAGVGPPFFRYWLADIGFPLFIAWAMWQVLFNHRFKVRRAQAKTHVQDLVALKQRVGDRKIALWVALGGSYLYEIISGFMVVAAKAVAPPEARFGVGEFDWFDILAYTLGALMGWLLLDRWRRYLGRFDAWAADMDARDAAGHAQAAVQQRTSAEKRRRRRRPAGGKPGKRGGK